MADKDWNREVKKRNAWLGKARNDAGKRFEANYITAGERSKWGQEAGQQPKDAEATVWDNKKNDYVRNGNGSIFKASYSLAKQMAQSWNKTKNNFNEQFPQGKILEEAAWEDRKNAWKGGETKNKVKGWLSRMGL